MASRFEGEKFTWKNDFSLWRMKMRALLIQQGLSAALEGEKGTAGAAGTAGAELDEKAPLKRAEIMLRLIVWWFYALVIRC